MFGAFTRSLVFALALFPALAFAQQPVLPGFPPGVFQNRGAIDAAPSGGCSQSATFLARTSGLSGTETIAYQALICGMVTDGTWSLFDALWVFATNTTTTANLNLISTSFGLTKTGTVTFTADSGYTGDGSTGFFNTAFTPSTNGVNFTQNTASFGTCVLNSRTTPQTWGELGSQNGGPYSYLLPYASGPVVQYNVNATAVFPSNASTNAQGSWILVRTGTNAGELYLNGAGLVAYTAAVQALTTIPFYIFAINVSGTATDISGDNLGYVFLAGGLTGTQAANIRSRLSTFLTTVNAGNTGC